jgi:hypothetical protein
MPGALTQEQLEQLQTYAAQGDRYKYWERNEKTYLWKH